MSIASGIISGLRSGLQSGLNPGSVNYSVDGASLKAVPANSTEWAALAVAAGYPSLTPSQLFLMQEASGNLADSIGGVTLTASGTVTYQNAISGWSRLGLGTTAGVAGQWSVAAGSGPDPTTQSAAVLCYVQIVGAGGLERGVLSLNSLAANYVSANVTAAGLARGYVAGGSVSGGTNYIGAGVFPLLLVYNRTGSIARLYTSSEKVTITYATFATNSTKEFGSASPPTARYLYGAWFAGAAAEFTDASAKALLQQMGWTIPWS